MPRHGLLIPLCEILVAFVTSAQAGECGGPASPDYKAERTVRVGDSVDHMTVYASGSMLREERQTPGGERITLRDMRSGRVVVLNPGTRTAAVLPGPRPASPPQTRVLDTTEPDGTRTRVRQFRSGANWLEISKAVCRPDGILVRERFVSLDPEGHEVEGAVTQSRIEVGPLPQGLFDVPPWAQDRDQGHR